MARIASASTATGESLICDLLFLRPLRRASSASTRSSLLPGFGSVAANTNWRMSSSTVAFDAAKSRPRSVRSRSNSRGTSLAGAFSVKM